MYVVVQCGVAYTASDVNMKLYRQVNRTTYRVVQSGVLCGIAWSHDRARAAMPQFGHHHSHHTDTITGTPPTQSHAVHSLIALHILVGAQNLGNCWRDRLVRIASDHLLEAHQ